MSKLLYRPRTTILYHFAGWLCCITCYPQQRWEQVDSDVEYVKLQYKHISIRISIEDFQENWIYVGSDKNDRTK